MAGRKNKVVYVVKYFGGSELRIELEKSLKGLTLLQSAASFKGITDYGLLGLRYSSNIFPGVYFWVDEMKSLGKQIDDMSEVFLCFKYYDPDPRKITCAKLRNFLYIQLRWDLIHNRIKATDENFVKLSAYTLRIEDGYYENEEQFLESYSKYVLWPTNVHFGDTSKLNIRDLVHQKYTQLKDTSIEAAQLTYLDICSNLDRYGMYYYPVTLLQEKKKLYYLSVNAQGIFLLDLQMIIHRRIPWQFCFDGISTFRKNINITIRPEFIKKDFGLPKPILTTKKMNSTFSFVAYSLEVCEHIYNYISLAHCFYVTVDSSSCKRYQTMPSLIGIKNKKEKFYLPYTLYQLRSSTAENSLYTTNFMREKSASMKCNDLHLMGIDNLNSRLKAKSTRSIMNQTQNKTCTLKRITSLRQTIKQMKVEQQGKKLLIKYGESFRRRSNTEPVLPNSQKVLTQSNEFSNEQVEMKNEPNKTQYSMNRNIPSFNLGRSSSQFNFGNERLSFEYLQNDFEQKKEQNNAATSNNVEENDLLEPIRLALVNIFGDAQGLFPIDLKKADNNWKNGLNKEKLHQVGEILKRISNTTPPRDFSSTRENSDSGFVKEWISGLCMNQDDEEQEGEEIDVAMDRLSKKFKLCEINSPTKNKNPMIVIQQEDNNIRFIDDLDDDIIQR